MPPMLPKPPDQPPTDVPAVRLALGGGMPMTGEALTKPDIRLALATNQSTSGGRDHNDSGFGKPDIRLATTIHSGAMSPEQFERALNARPEAPTIHLIGQRGVKPMADDSLPALLVSYFYLEQFLKNRHRYHYRDWVMDSGAFSAHNSGAEISLQAYIDQCKQLIASDPTLSEIYALDVIGDWKASHKNTQIMWDQGVPAIPCFHVGEPWEVLVGLAKDYPKIALGGVAQIGSKKALAWANQCFARIWPKKVHGFAMCSEIAVMTLPFHSVDSTSWEIGPCKFGNWRAFGGQRVSVRGSKQNLRAEVEWYLELERKARVKWKKQMAELEAIAPTVRLAVCFDKSHDMLARTHPAKPGPDVQLVAANDGGQGGARVLARALGESAADDGQLKQVERESSH